MEREESGNATLRRRADRLDELAALAQPVQHDLNNLLTVVFANLDMLKRRVTDEAPLRQLGRVQEAARRLEASTRAILSLARRPVPGEVVLSPATAVAALEPLLAVLLPAPGALALDLPPDLPACRFDQAWLDAALLGLARAAAGRGALRVAAAAAAGQVVITISLPAAAVAAAEVAVATLRRLAAAADGALTETPAAGTVVLSLALPLADPPAS